MKKLLLMMSILLSTGMFFACSNDDEMNVNGGDGSTLIPDDGVVLSPIDAFEVGNREDAAQLLGGPEAHMTKDFFFFNEELPLEKRSDSFFVGSDKDECYVINSLEELKNIYCGEKEIPYIDFEKYTLVIGQKIMPDFYHPVYKQELEFRNHQCDLNLYVPDYDPGFKAIQHFYYWAFYPKFNTEGINRVCFIKEKSVLKHIEDATGYVWMNYLANNKDGQREWESRMICGDGPVGASNHMNYYPINFPNDLVVDKEHAKHIRFSGDIVELNIESQERLDILEIGQFVYFIYLTNIEVTE